MTRQVLLHIGLPKTATTLIQECLYSAPPALADLGVAYLQTGSDEFDDRGHHVLVQALMGERGRALRHDTTAETLARVWPEAIAELKAAKAPVQVISSELFSFALTDPAHIAALKEQLSGFEVRVVLVLRDIAGFVDSVYAQRVKDGDPSALGTFVARNWHNLDWRTMLQRWARVFGRRNVRALDFADLKADGQVVENFLRRSLDLTIDGAIFEPDVTNVALPYYALQMIREVNASDIPQPVRIAFRRNVRRFFETHAEAAMAAGHFEKARFLSDDAKQVLDRHCKWPNTH